MTGLRWRNPRHRFPAASELRRNAAGAAARRGPRSGCDWLSPREIDTPPSLPVNPRPPQLPCLRILGAPTSDYPELVEGRPASGSPVTPIHPSTSSGRAGVAPPHPERTSRTLPKPRPAFGIPPGGQSVDEPVDRLKGVDAKTAQRLERLDVATVRDLLYLFSPAARRLFQRRQRFRSCAGPRECTVVAHRLGIARNRPRGQRPTQGYGRRFWAMTPAISRAIWFGQQYIARTLRTGS